MSDTVWLLWFEQEREEGEDMELLIGVYRTEEAAKGAIERLKDQPGFKDHPEGFRVYSRRFVDRRICKGLARDKRSSHTRSCRKADISGS